METFLIKALQLIAALAFLVIIHEFGHYIFARIFGIRVDKFYMFFNPRFSLLRYDPRANKVGLFVSQGDEEKKHPTTPQSLSRWARSIRPRPTAVRDGATQSTASDGCPSEVTAPSTE